MTKKFPYRYRILVFLFFLTLITYLDRISISLVGVRIKSEFDLTNEQFGWVLASFSLAYALFEIPSGIMGDRLGQRAVLIRIVFGGQFLLPYRSCNRADFFDSCPFSIWDGRSRSLSNKFRRSYHAGFLPAKPQEVCLLYLSDKTPGQRLRLLS